MFRLFITIILLATTNLLYANNSEHSKESIVVFAASSMTDALTNIKDLYLKDHPKVGNISLNFAGSSKLARQIDFAADADIFISADQKWMDFLSEKNKINKASRKVLLGNSLVVIKPKNLAEISEKSEKSVAVDIENLLTSAKFIALADYNHVPAGLYAKEWLEKIGLWQSVVGKIANAANVRAALGLVEVGQASLGVVYKTDAFASEKVEIVYQVSGDMHAKIEYPIALVANKKSSENSVKSLAVDFYKFLFSQKASEVFAAQGFTQP